MQKKKLIPVDTYIPRLFASIPTVPQTRGAIEPFHPPLLTESFHHNFLNTFSICRNKYRYKINSSLFLHYLKLSVDTLIFFYHNRKPAYLFFMHPQTQTFLPPYIFRKTDTLKISTLLFFSLKMNANNYAIIYFSP